MRVPTTVLTAVLLLSPASACASSRSSSSPSTLGTTTRTRSCAPTRIDTLYLARGLVYRSCEVDVQAAQLTRGAPLEYSPGGRPLLGCQSAEIEFVVSELGSPEPTGAKVIHATTQDLGRAVLNAVITSKYTPAQKGGIAVRQIVTYKMTANTVVVPAGQRPSGNARMPRC